LPLNSKLYGEGQVTQIQGHRFISQEVITLGNSFCEVQYSEALASIKKVSL